MHAHRRFVTIYVTLVDDADLPRDLAGVVAQVGADPAIEGEVAEAVTDALSHPVADDSAGRFVLAPEGGSAFHVDLPDPPATDVVHVGALPYVTPLVAWYQTLVDHAVVRLDADPVRIDVFPASGEPAGYELDDTVVTSDHAAVADGLAATVVATGVELVLLVGGAEVLGAVGDRMTTEVPTSVRVLTVAADEVPGVDELADRTVREVADHVARRTVERLRRFRFDRSHDLVVEGAAPTLNALHRGLVEVLIVHDDPLDDRVASFVDGEPVLATPPGDGRLVDVAVAVAMRDGVTIETIPSVPEERGPIGGIGGLLAPSASTPGDDDLVAAPAG